MRALGFETKPPSPPAAAAAGGGGGEKGKKEGVCMWRQAYDPSYSQVCYFQYLKSSYTSRLSLHTPVAEGLIH